MNIVENGTSYSVRFMFSKTYGNLTESNFNISIEQEGTLKLYDDTLTTFTVVNPVAPTYDAGGVMTSAGSYGSLTAIISAPSSDSIIKVALYKNDGITTRQIKISDITLRSVEIVATALSSTIN